jgi:hypothetical protein
MKRGIETICGPAQVCHAAGIIDNLTNVATAEEFSEHPQVTHMTPACPFLASATRLGIRDLLGIRHPAWHLTHQSCHNLLMDRRAHDARDSTDEIASRSLSTPFQDNQDLTVVIDVANFS